LRIGHGIASEMRDSPGISQMAPRDGAPSLPCSLARGSDDAFAVGRTQRRELIDERLERIRHFVVGRGFG
jgi:hypothetical protein